LKRYNERRPLTNDEIMKKFMLKYETIFRWMLVVFNKKEIVWDNVRRDFAEENIECYEIRQEEIANSFTDVTKKYWKNQKGITAKFRRTELFKSELFVHRKRQRCFGWENFGNRNGSFAKKALSFVREMILRNAGNQIGGIDWEEALLYSIASNGDFFGKGMMKYNKAQLYKRFLR
jgi:hypothetical protein